MTGLWRHLAKCRGVNGELFYPASYTDTRGAAQTTIAKAVCAACPVLEACLADALQDEQGKAAPSRYGIRGGLTSDERYQFATGKRPRNYRAKAAA